MTTNISWTKVIAAGQILFAAVGFFAGWISSTEAFALLVAGTSVLGIHLSNLEAARA
jgi:hypothetical protein